MKKDLEFHVNCLLGSDLSDRQTFHMKWQALFSLKNEKKNQDVICCSCD